MMKEILIEENKEELIDYKDTDKNKNKLINYFFFFQFLNLLKIAKKRNIKFEDVKEINKNLDIDAILHDESNNYLINKPKLLSFLIGKNRRRIIFIIILNILRILLMVLNPFLFKQFSKTNINILYLTILILSVDYFRAILSLKIELNSNELILSIDNQIKKIIIKNDLIIIKEKENITTNEKISNCNTLFNNDIETIKQYHF